MAKKSFLDIAEKVKVHSLASGSKGNATLIQMGEQNILMDVGISARSIERALSGLGVGIESVNAIFLTHEHRDHVAGLATMAKKYKMPIYATDGTKNALPKNCEEIKCEQWGVLKNKIDIGVVSVEPFAVPHDAADTVGYSFYWQNFKVSAVTDIGFVTTTVKNALADADILLLESNHDTSMLRNGRYPMMLKQRIASTRGHLSNNDAAWTLARLARKARQRVLLAHLSAENNCPHTAQKTVEDILCLQDIELGEGREIELKVAKQDAVVGF